MDKQVSYDGKDYCKGLTNQQNLTVSGAGSNLWSNYGDAHLYSGTEIWGMTATNPILKTHSNHLIMWDPAGLEYDPKRLLAVPGIDKDAITGLTVRYGVAKTLASTPPITLKNIPYSDELSLYNWYSSPEEALAQGKIAAVQTSADWRLDAPQNSDVIWVPLKVLSTPTKAIAQGNRRILMQNAQVTLPSGKVCEMVVDGPTNAHVSNTSKASDAGYYFPTIFNADGTVNTKTGTMANGVTATQQYWNTNGDSGFVMPYSVTTKTTVNQPVYQLTDTIKLQVRGIFQGDSTVSYGGALKMTLPAGIQYVAASTTDGQDNPMGEPVITTLGSGENAQQVLTWNFSKVDLANGLTLNFEAKPLPGGLSFANTGLTQPLKVSTVGNMCLTSEVGTSYPDTSGASELLRRSSTQFQEQLLQTLVVHKEVDKTALEVGNKATDTLNKGLDTSLTYTLEVENSLGVSISNIKLLDVLPYDKDSRGTILHGDYTVTKVAASRSNVTFNYTENLGGITEKTDPNSISGWQSWASGSAVPSKAKAILMTIPSLAVGENVTLTITIQPDDAQQAGDLLVNNATLNSNLDKQIYSQAVRTKVYGRDLSGFAWLDKDKNGQYDQDHEPMAANIPVRLYRQSTEDPTGGEVQVTSDLKGNSLVDATGNSTVLTDAQGQYRFENLPEDDYVVAFDIAGLVEKQYYRVTAPNVGQDDALNSKVDPKTYRTTSYPVSAPGLDAVGKNFGADSMVHMEYLNLGVTLPPENELPYTGAKDKFLIFLGLAALAGLGGLGMFVQRLKGEQK